MEDWYQEIRKGDLIKNKIADWINLLNQNLTEQHYHQFLAENAGLFLADTNCHLAISKLKFGSELETDFVTLSDGFSNGNLIELIEIKQPSAQLFTDKGHPSAELNRACQQIRDWKRWLIDNPSWCSKYLPTTSTRVIRNSNLRFKIIIGRRLVNPHDIEKRNQIADELGTEIRSFDYLTDRLRTREFFTHAWTSDAEDFFERELAKPFFSAFTDSEWKHFCKTRRVETFHFYSTHYRDIVKLRNGHLKSC
jgi:hypothetical protein